MDWTVTLGQALGSILPARLLDHVCSQNCAYRSVFEAATSYQQSDSRNAPYTIYPQPSKTILQPDLDIYSKFPSNVSSYPFADNVLWQSQTFTSSEVKSFAILFGLLLVATLTLSLVCAFQISQMWQRGEDLLAWVADDLFGCSTYPEATITNLHGIIAQRDKDTQTQSAMMAELQSEHDQCGLAVEQLKNDKHALQNKNSKLEAAFSHLTATLDVKSPCCTEAVQSVLDQMAQLRADKASSEVQLRDTRTACQQLENNNQEIAAKVSSLEKSLEEQTNESGEYKRRVLKLEETVRSQENTIAQRDREIIMQKDLYACQEATIADQRTTIAQRESVIREHERTATQHRATMGFQDRTIAQYKIDAAGLEATIRGQNSIITQQTTALIGHEATIDNQATRKRQIERCAGLPLHAQFVIDPCPKRMDGTGRRGRTSNVLKNFNLTAQRFTDIALRSGGGSVPRARERRHSIAVAATRFEIASQYYELGLTAIPTNCRERLEGKKKERLEVVSSTQSDFLLRGDLGRRLANNNLPASSAMVVRGSYELDTHDLALRRRDRNKPLPSVALDDISNDRISWGDVTKYNASNYFEWRRIRAEESARKMLSETVQSHLRHTAQDLKALDRYLKLHDLEKDRGSGNSLLHRLRAVSHHPSHAGLTKVTKDIAQRNKQVQKEFKSRIEIVIGLLEKWNKDLSKYTEATSSHETTGDTSGKKKRERSKRKADTDHPNADHEESSDEEVGPTPNASAQDGSTYTASNVSNGYGHTNRLAYEHASHGNDDNVLPQCEATENVVVEHGDSIDSQVGASQAQIEVPQPRKKTRRKTRPRKTIDQQETNGADPTKSDQHKVKASHEDGPGAGLQSSKWAQASGAKI